MDYQWPHDDTVSLIGFYGRPWLDMKLLIHITPPYSMYYEKSLVHGILIHHKCADALREALSKIWEACGREQQRIDFLGLSNYSGTYNYRNVRGGSKLSCHSFAAAIDMDAEHNPLGSTKGTMPPLAVEAFKSTGAIWGGDFVNRKDMMHFQWAHERKI